MSFPGFICRYKTAFNKSFCHVLLHQNIGKYSVSHQLIYNFYHVDKRKAYSKRETANFSLFSHQQLHKKTISHFRTFAGGRRMDNKANDNWEDILNNKEKRENIESIPVRKENIYTIPNLLTCSRIALTPYIGYLVISSNYNLALGLFILAGVTDFIDGQIARTWPSQQSAVGSALDPLADKILITVISLSLTYVNIIPLPLTILFIARDCLLITGVFYLRYRTCPRPLTLKRYFDPTLVNTKLEPTQLSKVNTALQLALVCFSIAAPVFNYVDHIFLKSLWCLTASTTVASGINYIFRKDTVKILKPDEKS